MHWTPRIRRLAGSVPRSSELRQWLDRKSKPRLGLRIKTWRSRRRGFGENDTTTEKELAEGRRIRRPRCLVFEIGGERAVPAAVRLLLAFQQILILGNQESKRAVAC